MNGIDYGAQIELRTTTSNAGQSAGSNTTSPSGTSSMYVKRAYGYIGTRQAGFVRLGQTDSAFSLLQTGVLEGFGDGAQWNIDGGILQTIARRAEHVRLRRHLQTLRHRQDRLPVADDRRLQHGRRLRAELERPEGRHRQLHPTSLYECSSISSSATLDSSTQRKNTIDAAVMYSGDFGGFATKANFGVLNAAPVNYTGTLSAAYPRYDDMTVYQAGAQTSYAGLTLGASVKWGAVNSGYTFIQRGARDGVAYIVNGTYVVGPYVIGASFFDQQAAGSYVAGSNDVCPHADAIWRRDRRQLRGRQGPQPVRTVHVRSYPSADHRRHRADTTCRCRSSRPAPPSSGNGLKHPGRPAQKKGGGQPPPFF